MTFERITTWCITVVAGLVTAGCGSGGTRSPGVTVEYILRLPGTATPVQFHNTEGVEITIREAVLVLWSQTLEDTCTGPDFAHWPRRMWTWILPAAHAHADADPRVQPVPHLLSLVPAVTEEIFLGSAAPPPGTYCGLSVALRQADTDTMGLEHHPDMLGQTLSVRGTYRINGAEPVSFTVSTGRTLVPARRLLPAPLELSAALPRAQILLKIQYDRWFDGIDVENLDDPVQQELLFGNITESVRVVSVSRP